MRKKGRTFDCSTCREEVQKQRRCHENRYNFEPVDGASFPIKIIEDSHGHGFCPAKIFRDDPSTVLYCEILFAAWKTGQGIDGEGVGGMLSDTLFDLNFLIRHWESLTRHQVYKFLGMMFGGDDNRSTSKKR